MNRIFALALLVPSLALAVPTVLQHQGRLHDSAGTPLDGTKSVTLTLFDASAGGDAQWTSTQDVTFEAGWFATDLDGVDAAAVEEDELWLELSVDGSIVGDRLPLRSVPFALRADTATHLSGGVVNATEVQIDGQTVIDSSGVTASVSWSSLTDVPTTVSQDALTDLASSCSTGQRLELGDSGWACADATAAHQHAAADITSGQLDIARLPVGNSSGTVAAGEHTHSLSSLNIDGDLDLGANQLLQARLENADGAPWDCDSSTAGAVYFDTSDSSFYGCDGTQFVAMGGAAAPGTADAPGSSCKSILDDGGAKGNGLYWVDFKGDGSAQRVYCDMTTEGGGWTLAAYHYNINPTWLDGTYHAVAGPAAVTDGDEMALDLTGVDYTEIAFFLDDDQWVDNTRTYQGWWIGDDSRSSYDLKSNACQILRPTEDSQWDGELIYFAGDGNNDNGCVGGGSVFTTGHTCDDYGGNITTNNAWPTNASDSLWGYNCVLWPRQGIYKQGPGNAAGLYAMYVR